MSSEESVGTNSSRLRQFGLYRNIDQRTEEFLKLSRKRQIRQGCACAAVSTAITVTIVVSVLIVFEYGFHSDPEPTLQSKHKPNWLSMPNDSEVKFDINQQHTNIKSSVLLPLLLKALKQNRILEKAIEEYSTPNYEEATDYPLERNVFTDARNWIRMPTARMYAIEYKTSPIVFFKTRNVDEFSRARKLMDSRRVTNYLDRMMNDKAAYQLPTISNAKGTNNGESDNSIKKMSSTARPKITTTHFARLEKRKKSIAKKDTATPTKKLHLNDCECPNNLKNILQKLYLVVKKLFLLNSKNLKVVSEDCFSTTSAPKQQTTTITIKRPPEVKNTDSSFPINLFQTIPKLSSKTKLLEILRRTTQSTTETIDPASLLISETTQKQNDASDNVNETTTFKPYLELPSYTTNITITKPMTPVTKDNMQSVKTTEHSEHFTKRSQNAHVSTPQYVDYDMNYVQINPTTVIPGKVTYYDEVWWNEENEVNKKKTLSNFLFKYKESQKNNTKFKDKRLVMYDDQVLDSDTMRNFNARNVLIKGERKIKIKTDKKKVNGSSFLKSKSKIAATTDEFGTVIRDLVAWNTVPFNITYGSIRLPSDSNEKPISALPQLSPPFLQIRRNEGRQGENDYHANTKI